ncbi:hypothetical protein BBO99_00006885 [Phytophthora kernoviae]|uniref:Glutamyl-tRNA(Gln) amidotransferase subunit B, mitochondrial n=1 Tax=Phytophthora kernoviae TaxID=325452 RepID=A0A3R7KHF5_9STRA|nr:hypothetical protein BBI17_008700 [Phytophthora kernoviae]RLN77263.1 hypothetical protein BBO99_00006885 [Phytophthora kernoviae]
MAQTASSTRPLLQLLRGSSGQLWEVCIGLEIHAQILSRSKLMSGSASSTLSSAKPNRHVSFFDAALPGTLPVINKEIVNQAIRTGLAVDATVNPRSMFERKHYFYCDLPLGYQLTQQRAPVASGGALHFELPSSAIISEHAAAKGGEETIFDASKYKSRKEKNEALRKWKAKQTAKQEEEDVIARSVRITRIQIEQDSGKSIHDLEDDSTVVDLNRAGTALLEIVMEPDLRSPLEAGQVMRQLQQLLRHLEVCDGNMEEGSMRCDLNVSVRPTNLGEDTDAEALHHALTSANAPPYGERVEVKNMNSIRNMMHAAEYEARRQIALIEEEGGEVHRETRSFDAATGETKRMRSKEGAKDYRFFPEPDLPPLVVTEKLIKQIGESLPELPAALKDRLCSQYDLTPYESSVLVNESGAAQYFESIAAQTSRSSKMVVNWVLNDLFGHLKATNGDIATSPVEAAELGELIDLIQDGTISGKIAKDVLELMFYENEAKKAPLEIVEEKRWKQIQNPEEIRALCQAVLEDPKAKKNLEAYWKGKTQLFGFFIGQVMKRCGGRVHPELANTIMQDILDEHKQ